MRDIFIAFAGFVGGLVSGAAVLLLAVAVRNAGGRRWRK
jgi:hypothetical protein